MPDPLEATCEVWHVGGLERPHKVQLRTYFRNHMIVTLSELTKVCHRNAAEMHIAHWTTMTSPRDSWNL